LVGSTYGRFCIKFPQNTTRPTKPPVFFFIISVPGKASSVWYLQDESNSQKESSKKEPSFEIVVPDDVMNLERSGSCGSKKKIKPVGSFEYIVSFI
jgi:hypothetical protein